jgi:hypothetical protein
MVHYVITLHIKSIIQMYCMVRLYITQQMLPIKDTWYLINHITSWAPFLFVVM